MWYAAWFLVGEEVRDCHLGYADWVRDVDVYEGIAGFGGVVFGGRGSWWVPEIGPWLWRGDVSWEWSWDGRDELARRLLRLDTQYLRLRNVRLLPQTSCLAVPNPSHLSSGR